MRNMTKGDVILAVAMEKEVPPVARFMGTGERTRNARRRAILSKTGRTRAPRPPGQPLSPYGVGEKSARIAGIPLHFFFRRPKKKITHTRIRPNPYQR